jgi:hypothetical protein
MRGHQYGGGSLAYALSGGSTTDTTTWQGMGGAFVGLPSRLVSIYVSMNFTLRHTVANAKVGVSVRLTDLDRNYIARERIRNVTLPTANQWFRVPLIAMFDANYLSLNIGTYILWPEVELATAGTLSYVQYNGASDLMTVLMSARQVE